MSPRVATNQRDQYMQVRREQILDAAVEVFGSKGYAEATVAGIAAAAGIAKGTFYLYFPSKEEIFTAILAERSFLPNLADLMVTDQPLGVTLRNIAESYYLFMDTNLSIYRIAVANACFFPTQARQVYREIILKGNQALADFLDRLSKAGVIPTLRDPFLTARIYFGLLSTYILSEEILCGKDIQPVDREAWIREIIQVFLDGVKSDSETDG